MENAIQRASSAEAAPHGQQPGCNDRIPDQEEEPAQIGKAAGWAISGVRGTAKSGRARPLLRRDHRLLRFSPGRGPRKLSLSRRSPKAWLLPRADGATRATACDGLQSWRQVAGRAH